MSYPRDYVACGGCRVETDSAAAAVAGSGLGMAERKWQLAGMSLARQPYVSTRYVAEQCWPESKDNDRNVSILSHVAVGGRVTDADGFKWERVA